MVKRFIKALNEDGSEGEQLDLEDFIAELLDPMVQQLIKDLKDFQTDTVKPLATRLETLETNATAPKDETGNKKQSPTEQRLAALEKELADAKQREADQAKREQQLRYESELSKTLDGYSPMFKATVEKLIKADLGGDVTEDESRGFLTKDGKTLKEYTDGFFQSEEGKHFLPAPSGGTGTRKPEAGRSQGKPAGMSLADALLNAPRPGL